MIQNNVIHQAYQSGVKKLMFLGSTCIYPRECPQPMKEEMKKRVREVEKGLKNDSTKKRLNEGEILEILGKYGITTSSPRSVVPSSPHPLFLSFLRSFVPSSPRPVVTVEIWGSGKPMREFLWSEEMADACVFLMENVDFKDVIKGQKVEKSEKSKSPKVEKSKSQALDSSTLRPFDSSTSTSFYAFDGPSDIRNTHINIGTGKEISIKALAELVKKTIGFQGELVFNTTKPDGTMRKLTDVTKLHELGWHHEIEIEEGVEKMYEWYRK